jgi:hypothetical protein
MHKFSNQQKLASHPQTEIGRPGIGNDENAHACSSAAGRRWQTGDMHIHIIEALWRVFVNPRLPRGLLVT